MSQQQINLGQADSGNGDPLRTAFDKVNDNFTELYSSVIATGVASTSASPPLSPGEGDLWWNTLDGNLYVYYSGIWASTNSGVQGPQGAQGDIGPEGPAGIRGLKGDTGEIGPRGYTGETGLQGDVGPRGLKGDKGDTGANGLKGDKGDTGEQGEQGPRGLKGDTGEQGLQGLKGDTGEAGPQGDRGSPGTQVQFSLTAPNPIAEGNVWWNMNDGNLYVYYNNQWVSAVSIAGLNSTNELVNGAHTVSLGTDGTLTLPGSLKVSNAPEGSIIGEGGVSINAKNGYQFSAAYQRAEILNPTPGYNANVAGFYLDGNGATIEINTDDTGNSWTFDTTGNLTFPNNTVQTTAWTGTTVPAHSYGAAGDRAGMVAFDADYIYYCTADYNLVTTYNVVAYDSDGPNAFLKTTVPWGSLPTYVVVGWTGVDENGATLTILDIQNNGGFTELAFNGTFVHQSENTYTLSNPGDIAIWKRTAHGTGTW